MKKKYINSNNVYYKYYKPKNNKKLLFWLLVIFLLAGIASFIWGGVIYHRYPDMSIARHITHLATKAARIQYVLGSLFIIVSWILSRKLK